MLCNGPYTPLKVPLPMGVSAPHLIHGSLDPRLSIPNCILIGSAVNYAQLKPEGPYTLQ